MDQTSNLTCECCGSLLIIDKPRDFCICGTCGWDNGFLQFYSPEGENPNREDWLMYRSMLSQAQQRHIRRTDADSSSSLPNHETLLARWQCKYGGLLSEIESAFDGIPSCNIKITSGMYIDSHAYDRLNEAAAIDDYVLWQDIPDERLWGGLEAFSHMDKASLDFHLPAVMRYLLRTIEIWESWQDAESSQEQYCRTTQLCESWVRKLAHYDSATLTSAQSHAVSGFLEALEAYPELPVRFDKILADALAAWKPLPSGEYDHFSLSGSH